jgi:hypothetical protein
MNAMFTIVAMLAILGQVECQAPTSLTSNVAVSTGYMFSQSFQYYSYTAPVGQQQVSFSALKTTSSGDPDIYVSTTNQMPNRTAYQYKNSNAGTSIIPPVSVPSVGTTYYIGVYAYSSGTFQVLVPPVSFIFCADHFQRQDHPLLPPH